MNSYINGLRNYATFTGRTSRNDYWLFMLIYIVFAMAAAIIDEATGYPGVFAGIVLLVHLLPGFAIVARRLHDIDHSAWWMLIMFIPLVGFVVMLAFLCTDSTAGTNRFGPNPKATGVTVTGPVASAAPTPVENSADG